ncbi:hypothetical protein LJC60_09810 [Ruminococcaceae bacterium OttesenSCG-928-D13]|nr:hypothetical protein [Ruminococcaceae bacterium OttesenSCG-928-D13]
MRWFVLQVASGWELKVRNTLLRNRLAARVPREETMIHRGGKWTPKERTLMPGYVFVGCEIETGEDLPAEVYYTAAKVHGVIRFLGDPRPQAITDAEAEWIGLLAPTDAALEASTVRSEDGAVLAGPLLEMLDRLVKIDRHRRRARVTIPLLGQEKTFEMSIQLEEGTNEAPSETTADPG